MVAQIYPSQFADQGARFPPNPERALSYGSKEVGALRQEW